MKFLLIFVAVIGFSSASTLFHKERRHEIQPLPASVKNLDDLLQQLISFIPFDKCKEIVEYYVANDDDVKQAYTFLLSEEFKMLTDKVIAMPEYQDFLKYMCDAGLDIYTYQNIIRKLFNLPPIEPPRKLHNRDITGESGLVKMIIDILNVLPLDEINIWFQNVCLPDPAFQNLLKKMASPEFQKLINDVYNLPEYKELTDVLKSQGIDVEAIEKAIEDYTHTPPDPPMKISPRSLVSLVDDLLKFIPTDKLLNILITYLQTDPDVQAVFTWLQGDSFRNLVVNLEGVQELKDFMNWLVSKKIDAYTYVNTVLDILGIPEFKPSKFPRFRNSMLRSGLTNMINDIIAVLPVDEIANWFITTCEPDPEFQELITRLKSDSFLVVVNTVRQDPAFPEMVSGLQKLDVDTDAIHNFLHNYFGW